MYREGLPFRYQQMMGMIEHTPPVEAQPMTAQEQATSDHTKGLFQLAGGVLLASMGSFGVGFEVTYANLESKADRAVIGGSLLVAVGGMKLMETGVRTANQAFKSVQSMRPARKKSKNNPFHLVK